jgi:predicted nucleic acid-binding protein
MKAGKTLVYWDTAVWLAWLLGERHWPATVLAGIEDVIVQLESGRLLLLTSSITRSEVFEGRLATEQKALWNSIMRRSDVQAIAADDRVNDRSAAIREYHKNRGTKIETPDAIHLATAVLYKAHEFQTMDGLDKSGKAKKILKLNGDVGGYPLFITQPYPRTGSPGQRHLFLSSALPEVGNDKNKTAGQSENSVGPQPDSASSAGNEARATKEEEKGPTPTAE